MVTSNSTCSASVVRARSLSVDGRPATDPTKPMTSTLRHSASGLSHGFQMDLKQAVQLEKQELKKMGLLPPPMVVETPLPKIVAPEDEDDESSTSPYWLYRQQRLGRRAASFSSGQHGACPPPMPCSPPVPIPQNHEAQRRYSAAGGLGEHTTHGVDAEQLQQMNKSQCEARLWDEFWNYKLSFESRESFEAYNVSTKMGTRARASSDHLDERTSKMSLLKYRSESSMASTADTVNEDDEDLDGSFGPEEEEEHVHHYGDVFEMDDL